MKHEVAGSVGAGQRGYLAALADAELGSERCGSPESTLGAWRRTTPSPTLEVYVHHSMCVAEFFSIRLIREARWR